MEKMRGRCLNCLARDHCAAQCRDPTKCWLCLRSGHISSWCPGRKQQQQNNTNTAIQLHQATPQPTLLSEKMEDLNLQERPEVEYCNLPLADELQQRIDFFKSRCLLLWIGRNRPHTEPSHVVQAFRRSFGVDPDNIQVSRHQPEDFLVQFTLREDFNAVADTRVFTSGGQEFRLRRWTPDHCGERDTKRYHVKLCLEGVPMRLWNDEFTAWLISRFGSFHYSEEQSGRRSDTRTFQLWAWCSVPRAIPKQLWVTVTDADEDGPEPLRPYEQWQIHRTQPVATRWGSMFDIRVHMETVVDLERNNARGEPVVVSLAWTLGTPDDTILIPHSIPSHNRRREPARRSCSAEVWPPHQRRRDHDDEDDEEEGADTAPQQRRGLLQCLRWPGDRGRQRERPPVNRSGNTSRYGRRNGMADRSLSPGTRRSRERSLERLVHRYSSRQPEPEDKKEAKHHERCRGDHKQTDDSSEEPPRVRTKKQKNTVEETQWYVYVDIHVHSIETGETREDPMIAEGNIDPNPPRKAAAASHVEFVTDIAPVLTAIDSNNSCLDPMAEEAHLVPHCT